MHVRSSLKFTQHYDYELCLLKIYPLHFMSLSKDFTVYDRH